MLFNLPETSLCITDMFVVTIPLKDSQERKCNEQHWETNLGKEVEQGHYSVKLRSPVGSTTCRLLHFTLSHTYVREQFLNVSSNWFVYHSYQK